MKNGKGKERVLSAGLAVRSPINIVNLVKVNTSDTRKLMKRVQKIEAENVEGFILC